MWHLDSWQSVLPVTNKKGEYSHHLLPWLKSSCPLHCTAEMRTLSKAGPRTRSDWGTRLPELSDSKCLSCQGCQTLSDTPFLKMAVPTASSPVSLGLQSDFSSSNSLPCYWNSRGPHPPAASPTVHAPNPHSNSHIFQACGQRNVGWAGWERKSPKSKCQTEQDGKSIPSLPVIFREHTQQPPKRVSVSTSPPLNISMQRPKQSFTKVNGMSNLSCYDPPLNSHFQQNPVLSMGNQLLPYVSSASL